VPPEPAIIAPPQRWQNGSKLPYPEITGSGDISGRVARGSTLTKDGLRSAFRGCITRSRPPTRALLSPWAVTKEPHRSGTAKGLDD
jgi:hypothetical protein